jgi:hypothetical protein
MLLMWTHVLSGNNAARTIGGEHVPHLLALYHEWHQLDTKHRHVNLRKAILNILKNITNLRKSLFTRFCCKIYILDYPESGDCRHGKCYFVIHRVFGHSGH